MKFKLFFSPEKMKMLIYLYFGLFKSYTAAFTKTKKAKQKYFKAQQTNMKNDQQSWHCVPPERREEHIK